MNLKLRITFLTTLLVILIGLLTLGIAGNRLTAQIEQIDHEFAEARTRSLNSIISNRMDDLFMVMNSWTYWTDLREATEKNNKVFLEDNLNVNALVQAGISAAVVLNKKGEMIYRAGDIALNPGVVAKIASDSKPTTCGFVMNPAVVLCITSIVNTDGSGASTGKLIFIQEAQTWLFPRIKIDRLSAKQIKFEAPTQYIRDPSVFGIDGYKTAVNGDNAESSVVIKTLDDKLMTIWVKFDGVSNKTLETGIVFYLLLQMASMAIIAFGIYFILKKTIFNHLEGFYSLIKTIDGDLNVPLAEIAGKDELERMTSFTIHALTETKLQKEELKRLSTTDHMTGLYNRRFFDEQLAYLTHQFHRLGHPPICLLMLDVDHFKKYNDTYGHDKGDEVLIAVAERMRQVARRNIDIVARLGGEEFAVILNNTDIEGAKKVAEMINSIIVAAAIPHSASDVSTVVTASIGVVQISKEMNHEQFYKAADEALYRAKHSGRNKFSI